MGQCFFSPSSVFIYNVLNISLHLYTYLGLVIPIPTVLLFNDGFRNLNFLPVAEPSYCMKIGVETFNHSGEVGIVSLYRNGADIFSKSKSIVRIGI